jgi:alkanesulfonate monooxygenase SsuD/methylene tetrahydromethanopterin reductase-like flavin-dependent oxidoreductase (luciferase family)
VTKVSMVFAVPEFLPLIDVAREAEEAGFDRIWTTENPGRDAMVRALTIGLSTTSIGIGTGIAYAFTRAPLSMAAAAADTNDALGGRFSLGLGAGTQGMRSRWYGISEFDHAASRLEEYSEILREVWRSPKNFSHEGRFYKGSYSELDGERNTVPIWGSGINPMMLKIAARSCDGVAVHPLGANPTYLDRVVIPSIKEGTEVSKKNPELALWRVTAINNDAELARSRARRSLAFYFSTPSYAIAADETGWGDVATAVREMYRNKGSKWDDISALIPNEMVAEFCLAGSPTSVIDDWHKIREEYATRGVTEVVFQAAAAGESSDETLTNLRSIVRVLSPNKSALK